MTDTPVRCSRCARSRADAPPAEALAWVMDNDNGRTTWLCPTCARTNLRSLEGKLPTEYW
jgi:hypothetical protein